MTGPSRGWYLDPSNNNRQRYWDGETWTVHQEPTPFYENKLTPLSSQEKQLWNAFSTLGPLVLGFLAPLISYLFIKDRDESTRIIALAALNGQISYTIYFFASCLLFFILIGFIILPIVVIVNFVAIILSFMASQRKEAYEYPFVIKLIM